ncbi:MAG: peptidylprolyl isomerase [Bacteroidota bacterium]
MKTIYIFFLASALAYGCASIETAEMPEKLPQLIEHEPFPPMSNTLLDNHPVFDLKILVAEDGSVVKAELLNPTGIVEWDTLAIARMKQWIFSPAIQNGKPISMWINFRARIKCEIPTYFRLAEIVCQNASTADSVYALLRTGENFETLVSRYSVANSKENRGDLGHVDISRYGEEVKHVLAELKENAFTEPIALGEHDVIFKRLTEDVRFQ